MASYNPPIENLAIFDTSVFQDTHNSTTTNPSGSYVRFPIAQGAETFPQINLTTPALLNIYNAGTIDGKPAGESTKSNITNMGSITCDTLNYTSLNPPIGGTVVPMYSAVYKGITISTATIDWSPGVGPINPFPYTPATFIQSTSNNCNFFEFDISNLVFSLSTFAGSSLPNQLLCRFFLSPVLAGEYPNDKTSNSISYNPTFTAQQFTSIGNNILYYQSPTLYSTIYFNIQLTWQLGTYGVGTSTFNLIDLSGNMKSTNVVIPT